MGFDLFSVMFVRGIVFIILPVISLARRSNVSGDSKTVTFSVTGDVNFNLNLTKYPPEFAWGNVLPVLESADFLFINHESTAANLPDPLPNDYKYQDPFNSTAALLAASSVSFAGQSNNHQFDFWGEGVNRTMQVLASEGQPQGGLYNATASSMVDRDNRKPVLFSGGLDVAVFSFVAQLCHKDPDTGLDILDSCTCGIPTDGDDDYTTPGMPPAQCYGANQTSPGLWYLPRPLVDHPTEVAGAVGAVAVYREAHPADVIVVNIHAGPNFEWEPAEDREKLLRDMSTAGADLVWGTSSHHLQRMEKGGDSESGFGTPIVFGLGDLLFRFIPGVDKPETCEQGMAPCEQFRPELSVVYDFTFSASSSSSSSSSSDDSSKPTRPQLTGIRAHATKHDSLQVQLAEGDDLHWIVDTFNNLSMPYGYEMREDTVSGELAVVPVKYQTPTSESRATTLSLSDIFVSGVSIFSWSSGLDVCYRIPALLRLHSGTILAFAAERLTGSQDSCSDESVSNIVMRRSLDGGSSWGEAVLVVPNEGAERTPWVSQDAETGKIFLFSNTNVSISDCSCGIFYVSSDDDGETWGGSVELPDDSSSGYYGTSLATGITHRATGRLVGCMRRICRNSCPAQYNSKAYFSDDHGETWGTSEWLTDGTTECQIAELASGDLYLNSRPYEGWEGASNVRLASWSSDAGDTWGPVMAVPDLIDFGFADEGSVASDPDSNVIYFTHPLAVDRSNLTLYSSSGNATSWQPVVTIYSGLAEYSSVAVLNPASSGGSGNHIGTLFEADDAGRIVFADINLDSAKEN